MKAFRAVLLVIGMSLLSWGHLFAAAGDRAAESSAPVMDMRIHPEDALDCLAACLRDAHDPVWALTAAPSHVMAGPLLSGTQRIRPSIKPLHPSGPGSTARPPNLFALNESYRI